MLENKLIHKSSVYDTTNNKNDSRTVFWGEVIEVDEFNNVKVRIPNLDNSVLNEDLPFTYPLIPKFIHFNPKIGEVVRVFIDDPNFPQRSRYWIGSVFSDLRNINYCNRYDAFATTNLKTSTTRKTLDTIPDSKGVFPNLDDIALLGRNNTDLILRENQLELRAGKHELNDVTKLNKKNPATLKLNFRSTDNKNNQISDALLLADRIALISHDGIPKFKSYDQDEEDIQKIFDEGHPLTRGDVLVKMLNIIRNTIINHIHGYNTLPADKDKLILELQDLDFNKILQKNIVIN